MLRAVVATTKDDRRLLILGLSEENVVRLRDGQPIHFDGAEVGLEGWGVVICHGQNEQSLAAELRANGLLPMEEEPDAKAAG